MGRALPLTAARAELAWLIRMGVGWPTGGPAFRSVDAAQPALMRRTETNETEAADGCG
jgi:hypothetical protein